MTGPQRILCVEDDSDIRTIAQFALHEVGGFTVAVCESGPEALALAPGWRPDLILLDVMMPGMDGPTTLAALRAIPETNQVPVVFLTARAPGRDGGGFDALGAAGVIVKPFDPMTLAAQVRALWAKAMDDRRGTP